MDLKISLTLDKHEGPAAITIRDDDGKDITQDLACHRIEFTHDCNDESEKELVLYCHPEDVDVNVLGEADIFPLAIWEGDNL